MDKIYSRKRIRLPKIKYKNEYRKNNSRNKKMLTVIVIFLIAFLVASGIIRSIEPVINKQCVYYAKSIATKVSNEQATAVMANYKYQDLCSIEKDESGNIKVIKSNIIPVNEITSDIAIKIQDEFDKTQNGDVFVRLGTLTGSKLLSGRGPKVKFKIVTNGNVETDLKSEFTSAGINQTLHQIFLDITCNVTIVTPYNSTTEQIKNQVLIAESVIIGDIPDSYYNFKSMDDNNALEIIE